MAGLNYQKMYNNVRLLTSAHHRWRPIFLLSANIKTPRRCGRTKERGTLASKHTEHYGLNQWEVSDQVLHSDFNEDNVKVDSALQKKLGHFERIDFRTTEESTRTIIFDLSQINWSDWEAVFLLFDCGFADDPERGIHFRCTLNDDKIRSFCSCNDHYFAYMTTAPIFITFLPHRDASRKIRGITAGASGLGIGVASFSELTSLDIVFEDSGRSLAAGLPLEIWGLR